MKNTKHIKSMLITLLAILLLATPVLAQQTPVVDKTGPDYTGNVIMAENLDYSIESDEALYTGAQKTGIPENGAGAAIQDQATSDVRCLTASLPQYELKTRNQPSKARNAQPQTEYRVGDTKIIYTPNYEDREELYGFTAEVAAVGKTCTIWRDKAHPEQLTDEAAQTYADAIDTRIHDPLQKAFGSWDNVDVDHDGKTAFVFYSMPYAGFFYSADLLDQEEEYATGNVMDMLHMSADTADKTEVTLSTLAHELQHMINYAQVGLNYDSWLNETFSQSAIAIAGLANSDTVYEVGTLSDWTAYAGFTYPFIFKNWYVSGDGESYGSWYLFGRYLSHQTEGLTGGGDEIYKSILAANSSGEGKTCTMADIEKALREMGYMGEGRTVSDIDDLITNYNLALYLREPTGIYSLSGNAESPSNVDGVQVDKFFPTQNAPSTLPGGGAASWSLIKGDNNSVTPKDYGTDLHFAGITTDVLLGVTINPQSNFLTYGGTVTLSTQDENAPILYTTDGTDPLENGEVYTEPITVTQHTILKARTVRSQEKYSPLSSQEYEVKPANVEASVPSGRVEAGTPVTLSCKTPGTQIWYTTDGSEPSAANGVHYTGPVTISQTTTLKAMSLMPDAENVRSGSVVTFAYDAGPGQGDRYEPNNSVTTATAVSFPGRLEATIHNPEDVDVYAFMLENSANLNLTLTPPDGASYSLTLCDETGSPLKASAYAGKSQSIRYTAATGKYLLKVAGMNGSSSEEQPYTLSLTRELDQSAVKNLDLSEMNMLTALNDKSEETGSGYAWDKGVDGGGHFLMSMAYYAHWSGPVNESLDPFNNEGPFNYKNQSDQAGYHVQNALYLPNGDRQNTIDNIKNAVYSYGAADITIMAASAYWSPDLKNLYVDRRDYAYPIEGADGFHAVTVVGWDDSYSRDQFTGNAALARAYGYPDAEIPKPDVDGAFIVKNSWGEGVGEAGYFYLSYADAFYCTTNNPAVFMADDLPDNYNHQYMNDPYGTVGFWTEDGAFTTTERFTNEKETPELLKAVSFVTGTANTRYEISVTQNGETKKVAEGVKKYAGFYTERLNQSVTIPQGSSFDINVRVENTEPDQSVGIGVSMNSSGSISGVKAAPDKAFISMNGITQDIGAGAIYPNIRAYTCDVNSHTYTESTLAAEASQAPTATLSQEVESHLQNVEITGQDTASVNGAVSVSIKGADNAQAPETDLPTKFDLRETGTMTPVHDQKTSSACWAFAATACVENNIARNGGFATDYPDGISLSESTKAVLLTKDAPEQPVTLTARLMGADSPSSTRINWSVSGDVDSVRLDHTFSQNGESVPVLTALKTGVVTLTAASDADMAVTASCTVTITVQGVESLGITPDKLTLNKGETGTLTAQAGPESAMDKTVLWTSDHPEIANVDKDGVVTAISGGKATITAKAGIATATAEVTVKGTPAVNPGSGSPKTGVMQDRMLSAALCAGLLALLLAGSVVYKKQRQH